MRRDVRVEPVVPELEQKSARTREVAINEFRILFDNYDPVVARDVAQRLANDFIETHINARVQTSQKSLEFMEGELDRLSKRVGEVEEEIAKVKAENPGTLPEELDANQRRLDRVLGELALAQRNYDQAASDEQFYTGQLASAKVSGSTGDDASPERRLEQLRIELSNYLARGFTEKHPDVVRTRDEITRLEQAVKTAGASEILNPLAQQTEAMARRSAGLRAAAQTEIERLAQVGD